jgi:class 3 adenylate cyclase/pimeloyl-ACP methyl ester carboxylesterase
VSDIPVTRTTKSGDGMSLGYLVAGGSGPPDLVFVGMGVSAFELMWEDPGFLRYARRLGTFGRTVWPNTRGWGASEGSPFDTYDPGTSNTDLLAVLDDVGIEKAALVGWSTVGGLAIDFAATHGDRVSALILINSCAHYVREEDYPWGFPRENLDQVAAFIREGWSTADDVPITNPSRIGDDRFRDWWGRVRRAGVGPAAYTESFRRSLEIDVRGVLHEIKIPSLVLHREGDRIVTLGAGRYLAEHLPGVKFVVLPGDDHFYFVGDTDALVDEIEEFLTGVRSGAEGEVVLAAVLFTDIVASTERQAQVGPREWSRLADRHDAMVRAALAHNRGHEVNTTGDGFLATFEATGRALRCASEVVAGAKDIGLDLRAGVHTGEVESRGGDLGGLAVVIAKRVCDLAEPGQVLVSETVRSHMVGSGIEFDDRGERDLKGVPGTWRLFAVTG